MVTFYGIYLIVDSRIFYSENHQKYLISSYKKNIFLSERPIKGIILGGSNGTFGLSAEMLSSSLNKKYLNLSISGEAYNESNFLEYITALIETKKLSDLETIIYTSNKIYEPSIIYANKNLYGRHSNIFLPSKSMLERLFQSLNKNFNNIYWPEVNEYGDILSYSNLCKPRVSFIKAELNTKLLINYYEVRFRNIRELLPANKIYLLIPPVLTDSEVDKFFLDDLSSKMDEFNVQLIVEPAIKKQRLFCDTAYHLTNLGRTIRTDNLINLIK